MTQKTIQPVASTEPRIQSLCRALEKGGTKVADNIVAFSKNLGKH